MQQNQELKNQTDGDSTFFGFEADFVDSLRCIPMAVRLRLDVTGIKLKLNEWAKLGQTDRLALARTSCRGPAAMQAYSEALSRLVEKTSGSRPSMLPELPEAIWEDPSQVPTQVTEQARALGLELPQPAWAALHPLQRFALTKLSRPGHENRNFLPAMQEFGLASAR